ncbi:MAG: KEOPS complex subunit Cgi121 [Candidatus Hodarchaeota archaeon]
MIIKTLEGPDFGKKFVGITAITNHEFEQSDLFQELEQLSKELNVVFQVFNADYIATWEHLFFAAFHALKAFEQGRNISDKMGVEILLYASAQRQIGIALEIAGIKPDTRHIALLTIGDLERVVEMGMTRIIKFMKGSEKNELLDIQNEEKFSDLCKIFNIGEKELAAVIVSKKWKDRVQGLKRIVLDRSALLAVEK